MKYRKSNHILLIIFKFKKHYIPVDSADIFFAEPLINYNYQSIYFLITSTVECHVISFYPIFDAAPAAQKTSDDSKVV